MMLSKHCSVHFYTMNLQDINDVKNLVPDLFIKLMLYVDLPSQEF